MNYRFLIHNCQSLVLQTFQLCGVFSKVGLRAHEYNRSSRTVMVHLWDPLGLHVPETGGAGDGETDQEHILNTNIVLSGLSSRYRAMSLQFPDMKEVSDGRSRPAQPCPTARG